MSESADKKSGTLIFPCSGAADVGEISDRAARRLSAEGPGKMFCLAGLGAKLDGYISKANAAERILAIDGCPVDCAAKILGSAGIDDFVHLRITDLGLEKGKTPATDENISTVVEKAKGMLA